MKSNIKEAINHISTNYKKYIDSKFDYNTDDLFIMIQMILPEYRLFIFKEISKFLNDKDYCLSLKYAYTKTSGINSEKPKMSLDEILELFKKADKRKLMGKDYEEYIKLPEIVTIYRGSNIKDYHNAISWTIDYNRAIWFYKKYESKGAVFKAKIKKKDILCYLDQTACNEKEVIVDYKKIFELEKISKSKINDNIDFSDINVGTVNTDYVIQASTYVLQTLVDNGVIPSEKLAEELYKSYQSRGKYKSKYNLFFPSGETISLGTFLEKISE